MLLHARRAYQQDEQLFSNWKTGEAKPFFISFEFMPASGPVTQGRSDLFYLYLFDDNEAPFPLPPIQLTTTKASSPSWVLPILVLLVFNIILFTVTFVACRMKKKDKNVEKTDNGKEVEVIRLPEIEPRKKSLALPKLEPSV